MLYANSFKSDLKKIKKQGRDLKKLDKVIDMLSKKQTLDSKYKDHVLYNNRKFKDCRDCHIEPDWVLIYKYLENESILLLINTGSHSKILNK